jgi:hypothetical protein
MREWFQVGSDVDAGLLRFGATRFTDIALWSSGNIDELLFYASPDPTVLRCSPLMLGVRLNIRTRFWLVFYVICVQ